MILFKSARGIVTFGGLSLDVCVRAYRELERNQ